MESDFIMIRMASPITGVSIVYPAASFSIDKIKHWSSVSLAFVRGIHLGPVNYLHNGPVMRKMFPFDDVIMYYLIQMNFNILLCFSVEEMMCNTNIFQCFLIKFQNKKNQILSYCPENKGFLPKNSHPHITHTFTGCNILDNKSKLFFLWQAKDEQQSVGSQGNVREKVRDFLLGSSYKWINLKIRKKIVKVFHKWKLP